MSDAEIPGPATTEAQAWGIFGAGTLCAALQIDADLTVQIVYDPEGFVTNQLVLKAPYLGGQSAEVGFLVTVTLPTGVEDVGEILARA